MKILWALKVMLKLGAKQKQPFTINFLIFHFLTFTTVELVTFEAIKILLKCIRLTFLKK